METLKSEVEMRLLPALEASAHDAKVVDFQVIKSGAKKEKERDCSQLFCWEIILNLLKIFMIDQPIQIILILFMPLFAT